MPISFSLRQPRPLAYLLVILTLLTLVLIALSGGNLPRALGAKVRPLVNLNITSHYVSATAPTDAQCRVQIGVPCYSPQEIRNAYGLTALINSGYTGKGESIVIIDSFGSPTIQADLKQFDQDFGLPDPPSFQVLAPLGSVPFDPTNGDMLGWAEETSLDVEWAHAIAPGASLVLLTSPVAETEGVQGMPEFLALEKFALDHHLGKIISQSWGATEETLSSPAGQSIVNQFEAFYMDAAGKHVTVLASSGDSGSANVGLDGVTLYPFPTVIYPASSPWVTAVGGTTLNADTSGNYQKEVVWDVPGLFGTGGGISKLFKMPDYQENLPKATRTTLNQHRGIPDISWNADPFTSVLVYLGFLGAGNNGYYLFGGTSEGSPQWAGVVAIANQYAHAPLGFLNPALYHLGKSKKAANSFHDITVGNNGLFGVSGYPATPGWDLSTGWGTPKGSSLIKALAGDDGGGED